MQLYTFPRFLDAANIHISAIFSMYYTTHFRDFLDFITIFVTIRTINMLK